MRDVDPPIVRGLDAIVPAPSCVTIGNFDGVHRGHQLLLRRTVDAALARDARSVAITFDPHPAAVLRPGTEPPLLSTVDERTRRLADAGVDLVVVLPFTLELSKRTPEEFVTQVLVDRLQACRVIVGTNFRFGHGAAGDLVTLVETGQVHGFDVEAVALREIDGVAVSSSAIRAALARGDVDFAARALGRDFTITATVIPGDGRGRTIGVPTANLEVDDMVVLPATGVYAGQVELDGALWPCVSNIGVRPTVSDDAQVSAECHVIDAPDGLDVYGKQLTVSFAHRLRGEARFASLDALVAQIGRDVDAARTWVATNRGAPPAVGRPAEFDG
ncbi:MAG: bifunctional riboflavin kinase/FAD synthetase [Nitriliruptoraceae bacterium]